MSGIRWTEEELAAHTGTRARPTAATVSSTRQKFNAQPTTVGTRRFGSKREAARYHELLLMLKAGMIRKLECHPRFDLHSLQPDGQWVQTARFTPDFRYLTPDGRVVVEDVKGGTATRTEAYAMRKRAWEAEYGQTLVEIG